MIITATIFLGLRRNILGFSRDTDSAIRRIIRTALLTAFFPTLFCICGAVLSIIWPTDDMAHDVLFIAFQIPLST